MNGRGSTTFSSFGIGNKKVIQAYKNHSEQLKFAATLNNAEATSC